MNKIIFDANVAASQSGTTGTNAMSMASTLQLPPGPMEIPVPEKGCVDAEYDDFNRKFSALAFARMLVCVKILACASGCYYISVGWIVLA
jgi:hypothetical protein